MVAIVGGSELGLNANSGSVLGGQGQTGSAGQGRSGEGVTVNAVTGNLVLQRQDELVIGTNTGPNIDILRTYNSRGLATDDNGDNWRLGVSRRVYGLSGTPNAAGSYVKRIDEDGSEIVYTWDATKSAYVSKAGAGGFDKLTYNTGTQVWTWYDGSSTRTETYAGASNGRLSTIVDPNGHTLTVNYTGSLVSSIVSSSGDQVTISYSGNNITQLLTSYKDSDNVTRTLTRVRYEYDANRLNKITVDLSPDDNSVADGKTYVTSYTYDGSSNRIASITQTDGSRLQFTYAQVAAGDYRVRTLQEMRLNDDNQYVQFSTTSFNYDLTNNQTLVVDGNGRQTFWNYDSYGQVKSIRQFVPGSGLTSQVQFAYDSDGNVASFTDALGNTTTYSYDNGNRILERDAMGNTVTRTFGARNELLTETTYTGIDSNPADANNATGARTTNYVYDSNYNLSYIVSPEGRVTRFTLDNKGRVASKQVFTETFDLVAAQPTLANLASWISTRPNKTQRTDYAYDIARGQLSTVIEYRSVDVNGLGQGGTATYYVYDQAGQLRQTMDANGHSSTYTYDGLGRILTSIEGAGVFTTTSYDDQHRRTTIRVDPDSNLHGGPVTTNTYDEDGLLLSVERGDTQVEVIATTHYVYDKRGNLVREIGPDGASTYHIYDSADRLIADIDPSGAVVEYVYGDPRINSTTSPTQLTQTTQTLAYTSPANIKLNLNIVPAAGSGSSLTAIVRTYSNGALHNSTNLTGLAASTTTSLNGIDVVGCDLLTVEIYSGTTLVGMVVQDGLANLIAQGAAHYAAAGNTAVTEPAVTVYEKQLITTGDKVQRTIRYANRVVVGLKYVDDDGIQRQATSVADGILQLGGTYDGVVGLRPGTSPDDRIDYSFYDAADRLIKTIDGTGAVKEFFYDGAGQLTYTQQSATRLSATKLSLLKFVAGNIAANNANATLPAGLTDYRIVQNARSADGKLIGVLDGDNYWTVNRYDAAGRLIETIRRALAGPDKFSVDNAADLHTYYLYDGKGQLTGEVDPAGYLTEYRYDDAGNKTTVTRYATAVTATNPSLLRIDDVRPTSNKEDRNTFYSYDAGNRVETMYEYQGEFRPEIYGFTDGVGTIYYDLDVNGKPTYTLRGKGSPDQVFSDVGGADAGTLQGQLIQREYDDYGRVTAEMSPSAYKVYLTALAPLAGETPEQLQARTDARNEGLWTRYTYDASGRMTSKTDPVDADGHANITLYYYDGNGRLIDVIDGAGTVHETSYNAFGEVSSTRTFNTLATVDKNLDRSQLVPISSARVSTDTFAYTRRGELASKTTGQGSVNADGTSNQGYEEFTYTAFGEKWTHKTLTAGSNYVYETFGYNGRSLVTSAVRDSGSGTANLTTTTQYDAFGRPIKVIDARNKEWNRIYDKLGRVVTITDPETPQRSIAYDAFNRVIEQIDALNAHTTFAYDAPTRTLTTTTQEGVVTIATSDAFGQVISLRDGRGNTATYTYDLDGRLVDTATPIGSGSEVAHSQKVYDNAGHLIEVIENGVKTAYTYDVIGRMLTRTVDAGSDPANLNITTRTVYNLGGEKMTDAGSDGIWTQDSSGIWTQTRYDLKGEVVSITVDPAMSPNGIGGLFAKPGALNLRTEFAYDSRGNKVKVTEGAGSANPKVTVYEYDNAGRRTAEVVDPGSAPALNIRTFYTYDANDNVVSKTDPNGNVTRYVYDDRNLLVYTIDPTGAVSKTVRDGNGRVVQATAYADLIALSGFATPSATVTGELTRAQVEALLTTPILNNAANQTSYTVYDRDGRVRFEIDAAKAVTERQYDKNGNVIRTTRYAMAIAVPTDRTVANVQTSVNAANTDASLNQNEYSVFDRANRQIYFIDAGGYATRTSYDSNGRIAQQVQYYTALVGTTGFYNGTDTFAPTITVNAANDRKMRMYYDAAGRLRFSVDGEGYVTERRYDGRGLEIARIRYATQYKTIITDADTYATITALLNVALTGSDARSTKVYDAAGRLDTQYDGDGSGELGVTRHVYDALGREVNTYVNEGLENRDSIATRVYDAAGRLTDEYGGNQSNPAATHTHYVLDKAGNRVAVVDPNGNTGYFFFDGDNRNVLQVDPEAYVTQTLYTAFGTVKEVVHYANKVVNAVSTTTPPVFVTDPVSGPYLIVDNTRDQHTLIEHDLRNRQTSITDAQNNVESMAYDALGNKTSYTNKLNGTYTYIYNRKGLVTKETAPVTYTATGVANAAQTKTYVYDARGNIITMTENSSATADQWRVTNFAYDLENRQVKKSSPPFSGFAADGSLAAALTPTEIRKYDSRGNLIEVAVYRDMVASSRVNDSRTLYYYDALDRKIVQIDPTGAVTAWVYSGIGKPVSELRYAVTIELPATAGGAIPQLPNDPNVRWTDFRYDGNGRMISSTLRNVTIGEQTNIDAGYTTRLQDIVTTYNYDGNGNTVRVIDGRGNPEQATIGNSTYSYYNKLNQLIMTVDALNYVTAWTRDANGNVLTETRYAKALASAPSSTTTPPAPPAVSSDDRVTTYTYDRMGNIKSKSVANVKYGSSTGSQLYLETLSDPNDLGTPEFYGNNWYPAATDTVFTTVVTMGDNSAGRSLAVGLDNNVSTPEANRRQLQAVFVNDTLCVDYYDSNGAYKREVLADVGSIKANTAYAVKLQKTLGGMKLTVTAQDAQQTQWTKEVADSTTPQWGVLRIKGGTYVGGDRGSPATRDGVGPLRIVNGNGDELMSEDFSSRMNDTYQHLMPVGGGNGSLWFTNNHTGAISVGQAELIGSTLTRYDYNGLGQITKITQSSDTATTEVTDITYDAIGRKTSQKNPQFKDFKQQDVRPETQYLYNGLDLVTSETQVHANYTGAELVDHVTTYAYNQGRLISQTDPAGNQTKFFYDAAGNIMKKTLVARTNADVVLGVAGATTTDDVTLYRYDAAGREVMHQDVGTGEVRGTSYNAFGEVTGHRLGGAYAFNATTGKWGWSDDNWQERAEYNVQGKAWRTNSGDGAYKVYLFDGNGNATLTIQSAGADLATQSLNEILGLEPTANGKPPAAVNTNLTVSIYDKRNQLIDTYQPTMVADNRIDWSANQIFTQPPGSPYVGGHVIVQNTQAQPAVGDISQAMGSLYPREIGIQLAGHDQDSRGGDSERLFKAQERSVTFTNLPDYSALGFNIIQIDFVLDLWIQPGYPYVDVNRNSFSGTTKTIYVGSGNTTAEISFTETGYDDDRKTGENNTPNRTGHYEMFAVNIFTGTKIRVGGDQIQFTVDKYFNNTHRNWDRYYHMSGTKLGMVNEQDKKFFVGGKQLVFNMNAVSSFQTATTDTLTLWMRASGGDWMRYDIKHETWSNGTVIPGFYSSEDQVIPQGTYEYFYTLQAVDGKVLAAQSGTMTMGSQGATNIVSKPIGLPGYGFVSEGKLRVIQQGANVGFVSVTYRRKNSTDGWSAGLMTRDVPFGWYLNLQGLAAGSEYEYIVETRNGSSKVVSKTKGYFTASSATTAYTASVQPLVDQIVKFDGQPLGKLGDGVTSMVLEYTTTNPDTNPNAVWTTASSSKLVQEPTDHTIFRWDATEALVAGVASNTTIYYRYAVKDRLGTILTQAKGTVNMGGSLPSVPPQQNYGRTPTLMTFNPIQENAQYLELHIRPKNSDPNAPYPTVIMLPRNNNGVFVWNCSAYAPVALDGKTELDFYYQLFDSATATEPLKDIALQPLKMKGQIIVGGTKADFVSSFQLTGLGNTSTTIHRSQAYNAFGEISEQSDGRVNAGNLPAFMAGRPNTTKLYYNTLGKLVQKEDPYTENLALVAKADGKIITVAPTHPRTYYAYDLLGRLVGTQDANRNQNSQTVLAGFGAEGSEPTLTTTEIHADSNRKAAKVIGYDIFGNARNLYDYYNETSYRLTQQEFDKNDRLTKVTHAQRDGTSASAIAGSTVDRYVYDGAGQRIVHYVDTVVGNVSTTTITNGVVSVTWPQNNNGTAVTYYDTTKYDSLGRVLATTDLMGLTTSYTYTYDATILGAGGAVVGGYIKTTTLPADSGLVDYTYTAPTNSAYDKNDYFGRIAEHKDFGGNVFTYQYNKAGWLIHQSSTGSAAQDYSGQQNIDFEYYANGYQKRITDNVSHAVSYYEYDNEGNRILEAYTVNGQPMQHSGIKYDQLNRVVYIEDASYNITYQYDANGNRIHVDANYVDGEGIPDRSQDFWYRYDSMNRFTVTMGVKNATTNVVEATTAQGVELSYDWTSQRVKAVYKDTADGHTPHQEIYTYTADGYLQDTWINYSLSGGSLVLQARRTNDGLGRVTDYEEWDGSGVKKLTRRTTYNKDSQALSQQEWAGNISGNALRTTDNWYSNTGVMIRSRYVDNTPNTGITVNKDYQYVWWDEAKQSKITVEGVEQQPDQFYGYFSPGYARFFYDVNGHIKAMNDPAYNPQNPDVFIARSVTYVTDAQGRILLRSEIGNGKPDLTGAVTSGSSGASHKFFYANGKGVGDVGNDGMRRMSYAESLALSQSTNNDKKNGQSWTPVESADFDANYEPITANYPSTTPGTYTVHTGDTLQSIAAATWGDSAMWYLIADANGLSGSEVLVADQVLIIPNKVANIHNNSGTFRVFDAAETMGNTDPTLPPLPKPPPPPRSKKGCGGIGTILIAVVAIIAAVYTAGAALAYFAPAAAGVAGAAGAGTMATLSAGGMAALTGSMGVMISAAGVAGFGMAVVAAGAIGAAVGSIVSQGLGMAMGMQDKFSWGQVGVAAIGGAVTAGLNNAGFAATAGRYLGEVGGQMAQAAVGSAVTQGLSVATGLQEKFSWTDVAASVAGAGAGEVMDGLLKNAKFGLGTFGNQVVRGTLRGLANGGVQSAVTHEKPNWGAVAMNSFGSSLGNTLVAKQVQADADAAEEPKLAAGQSTLQREYSERQMTIEAGPGRKLDSSAYEGQVGSHGEYPVANSNSSPAVERTSDLAYDEVLVTADAWRPEQYHYYDYLMQSGIFMDEERAANIAGNRFDALRFELSQRDANSLATFGPRPILQGVVNGGITAAQGLVELDTLLGGGGFDKAMARGSKLDAYKWHSDSELDQSVGSDIARLTGGMRSLSDQYFSDGITTGLSIVGESAMVAAGLAPVAGFRGISYISRNPLVDDLSGVPNSARAEVIADANTRSAYLSEKYGALTSEQRMARIDELSTSNYNRILANDLSQQDFVYRLVKSSDLPYYEAANSISGRAGTPTYFSLDTAGSIPEHMLGAQMKPAGYNTVLRIPVSEISNSAVPRPFGYEPVGARPTFGREYFTNSYPDYGSGGFRQFEATTKSYDPSWIYRRVP